MTDLDEAVRKLLTTKNHVGAMKDMIRIWGMEYVHHDEGHMHRLSKHPGDVLLAAMYRLHFKHEDLLADGKGVGVWTEYLAKILPFQASSTVGAPKPVWTSAKNDAMAAFSGPGGLGYKAAEVKELIAASSDADRLDDIIRDVLKQLGAERKAS